MGEGMVDRRDQDVGMHREWLGACGPALGWPAHNGKLYIALLQESDDPLAIVGDL